MDEEMNGHRWMRGYPGMKKSNQREKISNSKRKWVEREQVVNYGVTGVDGWMREDSTEQTDVIKTESKYLVKTDEVSSSKRD